MSSKLKIDTRVRSLKNYLEEFEQGVFQIPSFQRDFLWTQDDIKQLFDSIKNNYPIGSILFWKPSENASSWIGENKVGPFTIDNQTDKDPIYILDGFQRLSSLFGCLTNPQKFNNEKLTIDRKSWERNFSLYYDLEEEQFIYIRSNTNNQAYQVPVYVFMNSIDFRQYARKNFENLIDESKIELYYDRADAIGQIFTNYQIASVDINYANIEEAVEIFWRVNAKGVLISKDWIASALTNQGDFRLGTEIDKLLNELKIYNFEKLKRDIIFQCIQSSFGRIYFDYKIEDLVKRDDFVYVTNKTLISIKSAVKFLFEDLLVLNSKLIPYNSQLIFLTVFFNSLEGREPTNSQILSLKKWFWVTSYSNYFTIYSLSNQRKAFEIFKKFAEDESVDPIFRDNGKTQFTTAEFPSKIQMGSVRAKSLALFMINYSQGIKEISLDKIDSESVIKFEFGSLFSLPQRDNPAENLIPLISILKMNELTFEDLLKTKRRNSNSYLLQTKNLNLFIDEEIVHIFHNNKDIDELLEKRKKKIMREEEKFVKNLGVTYTDTDSFLLDF